MPSVSIEKTILSLIRSGGELRDTLLVAKELFDLGRFDAATTNAGDEPFPFLLFRELSMSKYFEPDALVSLLKLASKDVRTIKDSKGRTLWSTFIRQISDSDSIFRYDALLSYLSEPLPLAELSGGDESRFGYGMRKYGNIQTLLFSSDCFDTHSKLLGKGADFFGGGASVIPRSVNGWRYFIEKGMSPFVEVQDGDEKTFMWRKIIKHGKEPLVSEVSAWIAKQNPDALASHADEEYWKGFARYGSVDRHLKTVSDWHQRYDSEGVPAIVRAVLCDPSSFKTFRIVKKSFPAMRHLDSKGRNFWHAVFCQGKGFSDDVTKILCQENVPLVCSSNGLGVVVDTLNHRCGYSIRTYDGEIFPHPSRIPLLFETNSDARNLFACDEKEAVKFFQNTVKSYLGGRWDSSRFHLCLANFAAHPNLDRADVHPFVLGALVYSVIVSSNKGMAQGEPLVSKLCALGARFPEPLAADIRGKIEERNFDLLSFAENRMSLNDEREALGRISSEGAPKRNPRL